MIGSYVDSFPQAAPFYPVGRKPPISLPVPPVSSCTHPCRNFIQAVVVRGTVSRCFIYGMYGKGDEFMLGYLDNKSEWVHTCTLVEPVFLFNYSIAIASFICVRALFFFKAEKHGVCGCVVYLCVVFCACFCFGFGFVFFPRGTQPTTSPIRVLYTVRGWRKQQCCCDGVFKESHATVT